MRAARAMRRHASPRTLQTPLRREQPWDQAPGLPKAVPAEAPKADKSREPLANAEMETLQKLLARSKAAQETYSHFTQEQVDVIFKAVRGRGRGAGGGRRDAWRDLSD